MHDTVAIDIKENIYDENERIADHIREEMAAQNVLVINVMGAPGVGKTTALKQIIQHLRQRQPYVIEGDIESDLDTRELLALEIPTCQINTFGACHLDAPMVHDSLPRLAPAENGILFIENIGNLVCPAELSVGEHLRLLIVSVTDGSDKPYKYPLAFEKADLILLNKADLLPYVDFDEDFFMRGVRAQNKQAPVFKVCGRDGDGYAAVAQWLEQRDLKPSDR